MIASRKDRKVENDNYRELALVKQQTAHYQRLIARDPSQKVFEKGWFKRGRLEAAMNAPPGRMAGLYVGGRETASLGRVAFWLVFALCFGRFWCLGLEAPGGLTDALGFLLVYNFGGKAVNKLTEQKKKEADDDDQD